MAVERFYNYKISSEKIFKNKLVFPERTFNKRLKKRITEISNLSQNIIKDPEKGGVVMVGPLNEILLRSYNRFINEVTSYTPKNKSAEYKVWFKKSMNGLANSLKSTKNGCDKKCPKCFN